MNFRLAVSSDLEKIKTMYREIIENMNKNGLYIWDKEYPCEFFADDINNNCLYLLEENDEIISAFASSKSNRGENYIKWEESNCKALYIQRFGVNVKYFKRGIGKLMLKYAYKIAKENNAKYLRLFVADKNKPAIEFYLKNGFSKSQGVYEEKVNGHSFYQYGFEIKIL